MPSFLTFVVDDTNAVKAVFRPCPHFHAESLDGVRKPFDRMLKAMHDPKQDATEFARQFAQKCGSSVQLSDRGGTSNCIFLTPAGQFAVIGDSQTKGWLMVIGKWTSPTMIRQHLEPLAALYDPTKQMINFPKTDEQKLEPITLAEALERLAAA